MYLWRFSIAITLGLVWYCSDCGRTLTQYLCFLLCISTPLLSAVSGRESGTQTDEEAKDDTVQVVCAVVCVKTSCKTTVEVLIITIVSVRSVLQSRDGILYHLITLL